MSDLASRVCPEAATVVGALVKPLATLAGSSEGLQEPPRGMSVVMEYKVNSSGEWVCFALNPDRWYDLSMFEVVSRK